MFKPRAADLGVLADAKGRSRYWNGKKNAGGSHSDYFDIWRVYSLLPDLTLQNRLVNVARLASHPSDSAGHRVSGSIYIKEIL